MAKPTRNENTIDKLLQERTQFISWITRLTGPSSGPGVPDGVRQRVRADYEGRLQSVVEALRSHQADLEEQLAEFEARGDALSARESESKERLSEAEVRHMVGEYDDGRWQTIRADLTREVVAVQEELSRTVHEVERLNDVLATIRAPIIVEPVQGSPPAHAMAASPPPPAAAPVVHPAPPPPAPAPPPVMSPVMEPVAAPPPAASNEIPFKAPAAAAKPQPKAPVKPKDDAGRTLWFPSGKPGEGAPPKLDELAFLKSVTGSDPAVTPGRRPSGGFAKAAEPPAPPAPEPPPAQRPPEAAKDRPSSGAAPKTLKCGECGTMNRPTEWYCERCGAELAAL